MNMNMDVFAAKVCAAVEKNLGEGVRTEVRKVRKNNGTLLHGLLILSEGRTVVPTIYLECFLEAYKSGAPFEEVIGRLLSVYQRDIPQNNVDMEFFRHYEEVKNRVCYRLIGRRSNKDLLDEIPHVDFLDMAICFYYAYHDEGFGEGSILIYNSHMEMWDTSTEELFRLAQDNTPRIFPWRCIDVEEIRNELLIQNEDRNSGASSSQNDKMVDDPEIPMKVLSNNKRTCGAACILYPGVLQEIAKRDGDLYIIPSSIHETILLPYDNKMSVGYLKRMIQEVNRTQVAPEEVLSDSLYYYDAARKKIVIV